MRVEQRKQWYNSIQKNSVVGISTLTPGPLPQGRCYIIAHHLLQQLLSRWPREARVRVEQRKQWYNFIQKNSVVGISTLTPGPLPQAGEGVVVHYREVLRKSTCF